MNYCALAILPIAAPIVQATELPPSVRLAFETYTALPAQLVPVLKEVQDKASASAAAEKLKGRLTCIYEAREKLHNMPALTSSQNQLVRTRYGQRMREEWALMYEQITRLKNNRCYQSAEFAEIFHLMCMMIER